VRLHDTGEKPRRGGDELVGVDQELAAHREVWRVRARG
jgi:hypothetical protein